jgi:hypothetical protein
MIPDPLDASQQDSLPRIVLRIPGPWESLEQLRAALAKTGDSYIVPSVETGEAPYLLHQPTGQRFAFSVADRDDDIVELFADSGRVSPAEVRALRRHQAKVFISGPGGSLDAARTFLAIGAAFIRAGALAIMVDNCGNCHSPRDWLSLAGDKKLGGMYWAFVSVTAARDEVFSAGMHCLGFRDAELPDPADPQASGMMMHEFLGYTYQSGATILDGDPIGGPDGPEFILHHVECTRFPKDSPWHNPYGIWRFGDVKDEDEE